MTSSKKQFKVTNDKSEQCSTIELRDVFCFFAVPAGLEPATPGSEIEVTLIYDT